ncbi:MAG: polysaccharide deacetylase family protein [Sulfitobacter sp.]
MSIDWSPLKKELAIWRDEGRNLPLWWRDDDAIEDTPAFQKLTGMAAHLSLPVHVAVIPKHAQKSLAVACAATPWAVPIVHGWAHENHAPEGQKKAEFGHSRSEALTETAAGLDRLQALFGDNLLPMFVPPWNRIDALLTTHLAAQGYTALSTYTPRAKRLAAPNLVQINTHIDPIHWRGGGGLVAPETQIAAIVHLLQDRREARTDVAEPLGFLTHHLVHDAAIWDFTQACLSLLLDSGAVACDLRGALS